MTTPTTEVSTEVSARAAKAWGLPLLLPLMGLGLGALAARRFGFWSPWEIDRVLAAQALQRPEMWQLGEGWAQSRLTALAVAAFGTHEGWARLPAYAAAALGLWLLWQLLMAIGGKRAALAGVCVAASTPLFWLHGLSLLGDALTMAAQTAVGLTAWRWLQGDAVRQAPRDALGLLLAIGLAVLVGGVLQGVLAPLLASCIAAWLPCSGDGHGDTGSGSRQRRWALGGLGLLLAGGVGWAVLRDQPAYSLWLGGSARGLKPPGFEQVFTRLLHALAPWSAWLPFAVFAAAAGHGERQRAGLMLTLWLFLATACTTLFASRYGQPSLAMLAPCAGILALFLDQLTHERRDLRPVAVASLLLLLWVWRDTLLYPASPLQGWAPGPWSLPEVFHPRLGWSLAFAAFGLATWLTLVEAGATAPERPQAPPLRSLRHSLVAIWQRGFAQRGWLAAGLLLLVGLLLLGVLTWVLPEGRLPSVVRTWSRRLLLLPPALALAFVLGPRLRAAVQPNLHARPTWPVLIAGLAFGLYSAWGFLPAVSANFAPRDALAPLAAAVAAGEPLAVYRLPPETTQLYIGKAANRLDTSAQVDAYLQPTQRRWLVFPASELGDLDRSFRVRTQRHLFLADHQPGRTVVASNLPLAGRRNANPLAQIVLDQPPRIAHRIDALLGDQVELLGYRLDLPHGSFVGGGQRATITWYWRCLKPVSGNWRVFLHVDGRKPRLLGDHDMAEGLYPTSLWRPGDIVADQHSVRIPAHHGIDSPTMFVGLYNGGGRMPVQRGQRDNEDRIIAGPLHVR